MVKLLTVCAVLLASTASAGTIWPEQDIKDTTLYYPDSAVVVKVDSVYEQIQGTESYRLRLFPTVDTIMARKLAVKIGDLMVLMTKSQARLFREFVQVSVTDRPLKPDVIVGPNWLIGKESDAKK